MRRNDFFKYLLFGGGGSASRSELETETLPYTFYTQPKTLKNYRIYGNTENGQSVGDKTANLISNITEFLTAGTRTQANNVYAKVFTGLKPNTSYTLASNVPYGGTSNHLYIGTLSDFQAVYEGNPAIFTTDAYGQFDYMYATRARYKDLLNGNYWIMLVEGSTPPVVYEPYGYKIPVVVNEQTTNIYLDEPLAKSGENADYIEYKTQKRYNVDGTSENVALPEITVFDDENEISIDTTVQPSKVYIQGKISEIPSVSQSLQSSPQTLNLQPLSLDVMPIDRSIDRSEFQINDISEVPVEDENSVEEIPETENFETSGGEENAE